MPTERSLAGNHSVVALTPAGIPAASDIPNKPLKNAKLCHPVDNAAAAHASDHKKANTAKPILVPTASKINPAIGCITA